MEKCFYVYKIICLCGEWKDKYYIGSHYGYTDDKYTGSGKNIKEYFKLFGKNGTYKKEILEMSDNEIYIKDKEKELIFLHINDNHNLNISITSAGGITSDEHRENIRKGLMGHKLSEETKQKIREGNLGRKAWPNGRVFSDETKRKMSESRKGKFAGQNNPMSRTNREKRKAAQNAA